MDNIKQKGGGIILDDSSTEEEEAKNKKEIEEGIFYCDSCELQINSEESIRFPGDSCPECDEGYLQEN